jgi:hypothetical protein
MPKKILWGKKSKKKSLLNILKTDALFTSIKRDQQSAIMTEVVNRNSADESEEKPRTLVKQIESIVHKKIQYEVRSRKKRKNMRFNFDQIIK